MNVTQVAVCPSEASRKAGRPALTPELLAASGARYSRNNEGLEAILSKIDPHDLEKSVDSIFRMVDYGHQSIADMVPVAMFIDGISIWLAYYIWTLCPTAGGQESSTRYLKLSVAGLIPAEDLGIPAEQRAEWGGLMAASYNAYQTALKCWEGLSAENPSVMGIPRSLLEDGSDNARKKVARMRRNYAFDRARYFLPVAAATNVMLIMSARGWVNLCQHLLSHNLPELQRLGEAIRRELELPAPRMLKYARSNDLVRRAQAEEFEKLVQRAKTGSACIPACGCEKDKNAGKLDKGKNAGRDAGAPSGSSSPFLHVMLPPGVTEQEIARDLGCHTNRYAPFGAAVQRTGVRFGWSAIGFAEIRDLNRHRTGTKYCPQVPQGFYAALDQVPSAANNVGQIREMLTQQAEFGRGTCEKAGRLLRAADPTYIYWSLLGAEYPFEHTTTADKFIYEAELRTGLGAHYRYAKHLRDVLALWYEKFPSTRGLVLEGSAEPE